jgi:hypothetical protein
VKCTWSKDDGLATIAPFGTASAIWASSPSDVYVSVTTDSIQRLEWIAHFDGAHWTKEPLPAPVLDVQLASAAGGDVWAAGAQTGRSKLFRRSGGEWREAATLEGAVLPGFVLPVDAERVLAVGGIAGLVSWQQCGTEWVRTPSETPPMSTIYGVSTVASSRMFAFGGTGDYGTLSGVLARFDSGTWRGVAIPVKLTDVEAIAGWSYDDLYVLGRDRNPPGTQTVFHVTDGLATWIPVTSAAEISLEHVVGPIAGAIFGVGCAWPDKSSSAPSGCGRLVRLDRPAAPEPVDAESRPGPVWSDSAHGDIHMIGSVGNALRYLRAHCEKD